MWQTGHLIHKNDIKLHSDNLLALPAGTELNHYVVSDILGQGGFGIVYKAHHAHLDEQVVIKEFLPIELAGRQGATVTPHGTAKNEIYSECLRRFMEEGRTLVKLRHPNVVRCWDLFTANGTAYLVMDFEDGLSLQQLIQSLEAQDGHYSQEQLLHFLLPLAQGLAYIHSQGVLHRDIKPANVFIRRSDGSPVIIDFGAAKQNFALASQSQAPYTEFYAPLEQIEGGGEAKPTVDIHAFGGLMYRLVTGQVGPKAEARAMALVYGKPDPLASALALGENRYQPGLLSLINACLAFRADDRPQTMNAVVNQLKALAGEPNQNGYSVSQLDQLIAVAGADGVITEQEMQMLLNQAQTLGISSEHAQSYIVQQAVSKGWQLSSSSKSSATQSSPQQSEAQDFQDAFGDVFSEIFGNQAEKPGTVSADIQTELTIPLASVLHEQTHKLQFTRKQACQPCEGIGQRQPGWQSCTGCQGSGTVTNTQGFFQVQQRCPQCDGRGKVPQHPCLHCQGLGYNEHSVTLEIKIPKGIPDGGRLRFRGQGHRLSPHQQTEGGDVYLTVRYAAQSEFQVSGSDLYTVVTVSALPKSGSSYTVNSLTGPIAIKIPAGYQGEQIRIAGYGLPSDVSTDSRGHWYVKFQTVVDNRQGKRLMVLVEPACPAISGLSVVENIGIETQGGELTPLAQIGSTFNSPITQVFSTAEDNQQAITIKLFRGKGASVDDATALGTFDVSGLTPASKGEPQLEIALINIDGALYLQVQQLDKPAALTLTVSDAVVNNDGLSANNQTSPQSTNDRQGPSGFGGWLLLPLLGVLLMPFALIFANVELVQSLLTVLNSPDEWSKFHADLGDVMFYETLVFVALQGVFVLLSLYLAVLFLRKKRQTPKVFSALLVAHFAVFVLDSWIANEFTFVPEFWPLLLQQLLPMLIWVSYFKVSTRVKNTFVN